MAIGIDGEERSVRPNHDAVRGTYAPRRVIDLVHEGERRLLVRDGKVAAGETERRQRPQGRTETLRLDGERHIGAGKPMLREPVSVQLRGA
jgi:hypothetical protein